MSDTKKPAKRTSAAKSYDGFTEDERSAMKERARELKSAADPQAELLAKIAELAEPDRVMAERLHAVIMASVPTLQPRTYYGMPAWGKDGKVLCFFQPAAKFKTRYSTFGFNDGANLDDGDMWPTAYALAELTATIEKKIAALVKKAAS